MRNWVRNCTHLVFSFKSLLYSSFHKNKKFSSATTPNALAASFAFSFSHDFASRFLIILMIMHHQHMPKHACCQKYKQKQAVVFPAEKIASRKQ